MTKIGVVSDTHSQKIPQSVVAALRGVDLIVHAGDFCSLADYEFFAAIAKTVAVFGNMDEPAVRKKLTARMIFECEGIRIGLCHGEGPAPRVCEFVQEAFADSDVSVVVYGHSHQAMNKKIGNVLYFNPGSLTDTVYAPFCSYGILTVDGKNVSGEIIKVDTHG
jgi:uncharacterized protein